MPHEIGAETAADQTKTQSSIDANNPAKHKKDEAEASVLQIAAIYQLLPYIKGEYGNRFVRPAMEIYRSLLSSWQWSKEEQQLAENSKSHKITKPAYVAALHTIFKQEDDFFRSIHTLSFIQASRWDLHPLYQIDLKGADFVAVDLRGANLTGVGLKGTNLRWADLMGADLGEADLTGVNLGEADLTGANLRWADLSRAKLQGANLMWADLTGTNLTKTDLRRADLSQAKLYGAKLYGADLIEADLSGADLTRAAFRGADLRKAIYDKDAIKTAITDEKTKF